MKKVIGYRLREITSDRIMGYEYKCSICKNRYRHINKKFFNYLLQWESDYSLKEARKEAHACYRRCKKEEIKRKKDLKGIRVVISKQPTQNEIKTKLFIKKNNKNFVDSFNTDEYSNNLRPYFHKCEICERIFKTYPMRARPLKSEKLNRCYNEGIYRGKNICFCWKCWYSLLKKLEIDIIC